jgi:histone acetyltransferase
MAHVKTYLQAINVHNILTYADNTAIGYFKRQGFSLEINFDPNIWRRCIKDYEGATLIHCKIDRDVDYLRIHDILDQQKLLASAQLPDMSISTVNQWPVKSFRGIRIDKRPEIDVRGQMLQIVAKVKLHSRAWPFLKPVSKEDAPHYCEVIKSPMDLSTLENNVMEKRYNTIDQFAADMRLIFTNCFKYNAEDTVYSRSAKELEKYFEKLMSDYSAAQATWSMPPLE